MSPLILIIYVVLITAITLANFIFWLRFRAHRQELDNANAHDASSN
jgi:hypothetical protein